jgi:hypothetical protein
MVTPPLAAASADHTDVRGMKSERLGNTFLVGERVTVFDRHPCSCGKDFNEVLQNWMQLKPGAMVRA